MSSASRALARAALAAAILLCCSATLGGCGFLGGLSGTSSDRHRAWLNDGSLAISRPLPLASGLASARSRMNPNQATGPMQSSAASLRIDRVAGVLTIQSPGAAPLSINAQVASSMRPGRYTVALKQANPLWYAPASYFTQRSLPVPAEGSRERFKRGALGSYAIFLNEQTPIHTGPVGMPEIGGLRISPQEMSQIFEAIEVGAPVEVR